MAKFIVEQSRLKTIVHPKIKYLSSFVHALDNVKYVSTVFVRTMKVSGVQNNNWTLLIFSAWMKNTLRHFFIYIFCSTEECIQVRNDIKVSKW